MLPDISRLRIFIRPGSTDMRKQINGLACLVEELAQDPFSGNLYLFCGKTRKVLKALYWDKTGFSLLQKRLEKDSFPWPRTPDEVKEISEAEMRMLLSGIDFFRAHKTLHYRSVR
jgi:transposase